MDTLDKVNYYPPTISTTVTPPHMYSFILLNIARLFTKTKPKIKYCMIYIAYQHYLYVYVRFFLTEDVSDSESVFAKMEMYTKKGDLVKKIASVRSKNERP